MAYNSIEKLLERKKPWEYSFELEWEKGGYNFIEDPLDRYFIYKSTAPNCLNSRYEAGKDYAVNNMDKYGDITDPDGSGGDAELSIELYEKLWGRKEGASKKNTFLELDNDVFDNVVFGSETMNSAQTTLNEILKEVVQKRTEYKDEKLGSFSINYCIQLYVNYRDLFIKDLEEFDHLKSFLDSYHTLGNFVLVPAGFNGYRVTSTHDFWDSSLAHLKKYGFTSNYTIFKDEDFNRYINYFFLWDYVDKSGNDYKIKCLFDSHDKIEEGESLEKSKANWTNVTTEEADDFMEKSTTFIERRGIFMTAMLRLKAHIGNQYDTLRQTLFGINELYSGYEEVLKKILKWLDDNKLTLPENVKETLNEEWNLEKINNEL